MHLATHVPIVVHVLVVFSPRRRRGPVAARTHVRYRRVMPTLPCIDCGEPVRFPGQPADATCPACGTEQYLRGDGKTGRYPSKEPRRY